MLTSLQSSAWSQFQSPMATPGGSITQPAKVEWIRVSNVTSNPQAEESIHKELSEIVSWQFPGNSLKDVLDLLARQHGVEILLDKPALEHAGLNGEEQVSQEITGMKFKTALKLLLSNVVGSQLAYEIEDGAIKVTTQNALDEKLQTRIYDVRPLLPWTTTEELTIALQATVSSPVQMSKCGSIAAVGGQLLVRQPHGVHEEIESILNSLLRQFQME
ncbi:hypothetical protein [Planctomicrobium piriforme]|uniref:hypothetical protein n=1 Tax=Planctomicrobium piriforme TaxID=1576369 RepID=UPI00111439B1|nr:hypothetical protein [Planctomicrobium piriforme]